MYISVVKVSSSNNRHVCSFALCLVPSQPPENVNAMAVTSQSILVLWNPPPSSEQNGILIGYKILYRVVRDDEGKTYT